MESESESGSLDPSYLRSYVYVDGFNLFYGMREEKWREFYWLNLEALAREFAEGRGLKVDSVKYFTARIKGNQAKHERQAKYLDALSTLSSTRIFEGEYIPEYSPCPNCHHRKSTPKEKQTDTAIATQFVADAYENAWDVAYLVSGDSDLAPPVRLVKERFPAKRVIIASPPMRTSRDLWKIYQSSFQINKVMLKSSQFPDVVTLANGRTVERPEKWSV